MWALVENQETGEVFQAVPDSEWTTSLERWRQAMRLCGHDVKRCPLPSPIPAGHVMFRKKSRYPYRQVLKRILALPGGLAIEHRIGRNFAQHPLVIVTVPGHCQFQATRKQAAEIVRKCWRAIQAEMRRRNEAIGA